MNNFVVQHNLIFSELNRLWMFLKQLLPIVVTLQVLQDTFKFMHFIIHRMIKHALQPEIG